MPRISQVMFFDCTFCHFFKVHFLSFRWLRWLEQVQVIPTTPISRFFRWNILGNGQASPPSHGALGHWTVSTSQLGEILHFYSDIVHKNILDLQYLFCNLHLRSKLTPSSLRQKGCPNLNNKSKWVGQWLFPWRCFYCATSFTLKDTCSTTSVRWNFGRSESLLTLGATSHYPNILPANAWCDLATTSRWAPTMPLRSSWLKQKDGLNPYSILAQESPLLEIWAGYGTCSIWSLVCCKKMKVTQVTSCHMIHRWSMHRVHWNASSCDAKNRND